MPTKPKHQPTRTCIACRQARPKREMVRIVRGLDGTVALDPTGKANGRGAYLCAKTTCWEQALKRRSLNHALKSELDAETIQRLRDHAAGFESDPS